VGGKNAPAWNATQTSKAQEEKLAETGGHASAPGAGSSRKKVAEVAAAPSAAAQQPVAEGSSSAEPPAQG
jgi:hypothetical protein